jgi:predicted nucleotide-binding protein
LIGKDKTMNKDRMKTFPPVQAMVSPEEIIELLKIQKNKGEELLKGNFLSLEDVKSWNISSKAILTKAFGPNLENIDSMIRVGNHKSYPVYEPDSIMEKRRREKIQVALDMIASCLKYLQNLGKEPLEAEPPEKEEGEKSPVKRDLPIEPVPDDEENKASLFTEESKTETQEKAEREEKLDNRKVLIISGQEKEKKFALVDFLKQLGLKPVLPQEEPGPEKNLIDKFEKYSDVAFAILLLTGDDYGYPKGKPEEARPRPKQNVIFELGFLIGRLKQNNIFCALYEEGLDLPPVYQGNFFIPYDSEGLWKLFIARAMKMANVDVDMNKAL